MICFPYDVHVPDANSKPTVDELRQRREFYKRIAELTSHASETPGPFPTIEQMIREDRDR